MKRQIAIIAALLMTPTLFVGTSVRAGAETVRYADVWIVAGQSNAAGYSNADKSVSGVSYRELLTEDDSRNATGYSNVLYYGEVDRYASNNTFRLSSQAVKIGQGNASYTIGPELGMAKVLSESVSESDTAVIIKCAAGGTYLTDYEGRYPQTGTYGSWASPSATAQAEEEGIGLHANNGLLYERLLEAVRDGLSDLKTNGYTPVVKGYIWMQGEADAVDATLAARYEGALELFIDDLRSDVAELTQDGFAAVRPFVLGKICSSGYYGNYIDAVRAAQSSVCERVINVYSVETDDLPIHENGELLGSDDYHFNAWDMYLLGQRFASRATENLYRYFFAVQAGEGGNVEQEFYFTDGDAFAVAYTADRGKKLVSVLLNGTDVTDRCVSGGTISVTPAAGEEGANTVELVFADAETYSLSVTVGEGGKVTRSIGGSLVYAGDVLILSPAPYVGYETDRVLCNGAELTADGNGNFTVTVEGDCAVTVSFKRQTEISGETAPPSAGSGLPAWAVALIACGGVLVVAGVVLGVTVVRKKRKK